MFGEPAHYSAVFVLAAALFAACLLCWSVMLEGPKLTPAIVVIALILPLVVTYLAIRERGIMDPTALFPAFFAVYNGILLTRFLSEEVRDKLVYPVKFDSEIFFRAGLYCALGAIFIAISWAALKPSPYKNTAAPDTTGWFKVGTAFYAMGFLMYLVQYIQVGGYWAALAINRTKRFEVMTEAISLPYFSFVLVGLVMMMASGSRRRQRVLTIALTTVWCLMVVVQGDRRLLLQTVFAVVSAATFLRAKSTRIRMKHVLLVVIAYIALAIAGQLREKIPALVSGSSSSQKELIPGKSDSLLDSAKPENSELAGPFLSVLYNAQTVKEHSLGSTYIDTALSILPRVMYRPKPTPPSAELAEAMHRGGFNFAVSGWGYSPIAEAFLNFGILGVCFIPALWMAGFIVISHLRQYSWGMVAAAVLAPESINANRIDFRTVYLESFYCLVAVVLAALVVRTFFQRSASRVPVPRPARGQMATARVSGGQPVPIG